MELQELMIHPCIKQSARHLPIASLIQISIFQALAAMLGMFLLTIWPGGAIWQFMSKIIGGGVSETFLYPIYGGMILLAGLIVGCTVVVLEEVKSIKEEIKNLRNTDSEKE